jgi:hypothetical protein
MVAEMETVLPSQLLADIKQSYDFPNQAIYAADNLRRNNLVTKVYCRSDRG